MTDPTIPWSAGPDPTAQLPDPTDVIPTVPAGYLEVSTVDESRWPPVIDVVVRYAPVGTSSSWERLKRWTTVHPEAWKLADLRAQGADAHEAHDAMKSEQWWALARRKAAGAAGVAGLAVATWKLVGAHGMWPLFATSLAVPAWYTVKGWVLVRRTAQVPPVATTDYVAGPDWSTGLAGPDHRTETLDGPDDGPRGLRRLVRPDRTAPAPDAQPVPPDPVRAAGPCPLTQDRVERALKAAKPKLRSIKTDGDEPVVQVLASRHMGNGWSVTVALPEDMPATEVCADRHRVANAFSTPQRGIPDSCVIMIPDQSNPRLLQLWICDHDPLAGPPSWTGLDRTDEIDSFDPVVVGRSIDGDEISVDMVGTHLRISGDTGSGKTRLALLLAAHLAKDPHHQHVFIDPDNMGTWDPFAEIGEFFGGRGSFKAAANRLQQIVELEFEERARKIAEYRRRYPMRMTESAITREIARDAEWDMPLVTVWVDEFQALLRDPDHGTRFTAYFETIVERGRKFGIQLKGISQKMSGRKIDTDVRDIFTSQACGSVQTGPAATMGLGPDWRAKGMDPLALKPKINSGAFYMQGPILGSSPVDWVLFRADFIDDNGVRLIARQALELRRRVRPQLLPGHLAVPVLDLAPLRHVAEVLEIDGVLPAPSIVDELAHRWPDRYGEMDSTRKALDELLKPFDVATTQVTLDGKRPYSLRYRAVIAALRRLGDDLETDRRRTGASPVAETGPETEETGSDLHVRGDVSASPPLPVLDVDLAKPQVNGPGERDR